MADTQTTTPATRSYDQTASPTEPSVVDANGELIDHLKSYARERPDVAALWCLGIGFVLGWKLKPW